ncbi:MAG: glucose-1-phosphate cytidylyltransferase [Gemmatimonadaceae bacterium]|nr:glucose-1-phosphate cytidylyltransferase [Gemmatimonadaceae bacterium]
MKVVLFCGGLGLRLREYSETVPKPMVPIGYRPVLWHLMKYYAHYGHKDFILCLGHRADAIKEYFLNYQETLSNDFVLTGHGKHVELLKSDIDDWRITFVDTGLHSNLGERLTMVREHLAGEETFLANYSDGLSDLHLPDMLAHYEASNSVGSFLCAQPSLSFHFVSLAPDGHVKAITDIHGSGLLVNAGYFIFNKAIFDYIKPGEELVLEPFERLIQAGKLAAYKYDGFWRGMDTFKDKQGLDDLFARGKAPWEVWKRPDHAWGK